MIGRRLGVYEITAVIGAGGMGEVYRARDARLGRDVAIKTLPPPFSNDPDRVALLEREARVLASLLEGEPDWSALPASAPPRIIELLRRCLAKDPKERLRGWRSTAHQPSHFPSRGGEG
jgi:hypothetical protein